jgi:hypothetical protein
MRRRRLTWLPDFYYGNIMSIVSAGRFIIIHGGNCNSNGEILMFAKLHRNEKLCEARFMIQRTPLVMP